MEAEREDYDPEVNVCGNQSNFNVALRQALKYNTRVSIKRNQKALSCAFVVYLVLLFWAIYLAKKSMTMRKENLLFSIVFPPAYILAHYLS